MSTDNDNLNTDIKTLNKQNYIQNARSRHQKRNENQPRRSASEPLHGGQFGRRYTGNRGKVKPESDVGGCIYCQHLVNNSRRKSMDVKLEASGYYKNI